MNKFEYPPGLSAVFTHAGKCACTVRAACVGVYVPDSVPVGGGTTWCGANAPRGGALSDDGATSIFERDIEELGQGVGTRRYVLCVRR